MLNPAVSVVMPAHNMVRFIGQAIESVLQQTWRSFEIIVVDDRSTDGTVEAVKSIQDPRLRLLCHDRNYGPSAARNTGIRAARGVYIAFLDADDIWLSTKLTKQVALLEDDPRVGLVYCGAHEVDIKLRPLRTPSVGDPWPTAGDEAFERIALRRYFILAPFSTMVVRRSCFDELGLFDESIAQGEEWDLAFRLAYRWNIRYVSEPLTLYRMTGHFMPEKRLGRHINEAQQTTIERAFARIGEFPKWQLLRQQIRIQNFWTTVLHLYAIHEPKRARQMLKDIMSDMPKFLDFTDSTMMDSIAYTAWGLYDTVTPLNDALDFVRYVFDHLPGSVSDRSLARKKTLAKVCAICAFDSAHRGEIYQVWTGAIRAIAYEPSWCRNKGLLKQLIRVLERKYTLSTMQKPSNYHIGN